MAKHTIDLSDECDRRLAVLVAEYNARNQTAFALDAWLQLHIREIAIGRDLAASVAALTEQIAAPGGSRPERRRGGREGSAPGAGVVSRQPRPCGRKPGGCRGAAYMSHGKDPT